MTRRFRPPVPLAVQCHPDGTPRAFTYRHRTRHVTRIVSTWDMPAAWWVEEAPDQEALLLRARTYLRLIADEHLACEVFRGDTGGWYLDRIID